MQKKALQEPVLNEGVSFTDEALDEIARVTEGYPYFLQEWGYQAWNIAEKSPIEIDVVKRATEASIARLDQSFFRVRLDRLTPREKDYLRALAELGADPQRSGDIAEKLGVEVNRVAPLRNGLIKKGMIYSPAHGDTAFTVPLFEAFMKRTMPDLPVPKNKKTSETSGIDH
jgi:DNA-binding CsgD family transcriptional regulator